MNLVVNDTSFSYKNFTIFDSINLIISKGEFICLVGANGSGKSTLLRLIFGDIKPNSGEIFIEGSNKQKIRNIAQNIIKYCAKIGVLLEQYCVILRYFLYASLRCAIKA